MRKPSLFTMAIGALEFTLLVTVLVVGVGFELFELTRKSR